MPDPSPRSPRPVSTDVFRNAEAPAVIEDFDPLAVEDLALPAGWSIATALDQSLLGTRVVVRADLLGTVRVLALHPVATSRLAYLKALRHQVQTVGAVRHPHLLALRRFLVHQHLLVSVHPPQHTSLADTLRSGRLMAIADSLAILRQVALALQELDRLGFAHGWVRPECVLVGPGNHVLLDDGCVPKPISLLANATSPGEADHWLAPDVVVGGQPQRATDVFAVGSLLYRMLTGQSPLRGQSNRLAVRDFIMGGPPDLGAIHLQWGDEVADFLAACLQREPQNRPATWPAVIARIDAMLHGPPDDPEAASIRPASEMIIVDRPLTPMTPNTKVVLRNRRASSRMRLALVAGLALLIVAIPPAIWALSRLAGDAPAAPASAPAPVSPVPHAAATVAAVVAAPEPVSEAMESAVDRLLDQERFAAAFALCATWPFAQRLAWEERIIGSHLRQRAILADRLRAIDDPLAAFRLLQKSVETWGMPSDRTWADGIMADLRTRASVTDAQPIASSTAATTAAIAATAAGAAPLSDRFLRGQGWEPSGRVEVTDGRIRLLPAPQRPSAITAAIRDQVIGWRFSLRSVDEGLNEVVFRLSGLDGENEEWRDLRVLLRQTDGEQPEFAVRWDGSLFRITNAIGTTIAREQIAFRPMSLTCRTAAGEVQIIGMPVPLAMAGGGR